MLGTKTAVLVVVVCFVQITAAILPGGSMPGGVGECETFDPQHEELANIALVQMNKGYTLEHILCVRSQLVAGLMYYMELSVTRNTNTSSGAGSSCLHCDVTVFQGFSGTGPELDSHNCEEVTCLS